ncbi:MAG: histidine phosphatase family protein [Lachnospiraceae bacterium]|nr:histidine phosphatase family protein [Lachnospiraceae bacterium]
MNEYKKSKITFILSIILVIVATVALVLVLVRACSNNSDSKAVTIYFVRHAQTDSNAKGVLAGCETDAKLTEEGKKQAKTTGESLADISFDTTFTSELSRTQDTANIILNENKNKKPDITINPLLNDVNWGEAAGLTPKEVAAKYPNFSEDNYLGTINDGNFTSPIGASTKYSKVSDYDKAIEKVVEKTPDKGTALVVGHSSFVWALMAHFPDEISDGYNLSNASVTIFEVNDGKWTLKQLNKFP